MMPSGWLFIMMCTLLRLIEGVGSALFLTGSLAIIPQLYPNSVGFVSVSWLTSTYSVSMFTNLHVGTVITVLYAHGRCTLETAEVGGGLILHILHIKHVVYAHHYSKVHKLPEQQPKCRVVVIIECTAVEVIHHTKQTLISIYTVQVNYAPKQVGVCYIYYKSARKGG